MKRFMISIPSFVLGGGATRGLWESAAKGPSAQRPLMLQKQLARRVEK
jgi:hypothetical protein